MRWFKLNIEQLTIDYLGQLFGAIRLQRWCFVMVSPLTTLWDSYDAWRRRQFYLINITSQVFSIKNYLNDEFDDVQRRIAITSVVTSSGIFISLEAELNPSLDVPLSTEGLTDVPIAATFDYDASDNFVIVVPPELINQEAQIVAAIEDKKAGGRRFQVVFE